MNAFSFFGNESFRSIETLRSKNQKKRSSSGIVSLPTDEKENMTEPFCLYGREVLGGERKVRVYE